MMDLAFVEIGIDHDEHVLNRNNQTMINSLMSKNADKMGGPCVQGGNCVAEGIGVNVVSTCRSTQ